MINRIKIIIVFLPMVGMLHAQYSSPEYQNLKERVRICTVIDKSLSIKDQGNFATCREIYDLCAHINERSGELSVMMIGDNSRQYLESYRSIADNIERPTERKQGESPQDFKERIRKWKEGKKGKTADDITTFLNSPNVAHILNYDRLERSSDVCSGVDLAIRRVHEPDSELRFARKVIILLTDGRDSYGNCDITENKDATILVVHRSENVGILNKYVRPHHIFTSFDQAVRYVVHNM